MSNSVNRTSLSLYITRMNETLNIPNTTTQAAIKEAQDDSNLTTVDMNSFDSFLKSLEINKIRSDPFS